MILILLVAAIFGFVLSTLLFLKTSTNTKATLLLGSFYFLLSVYALQAFIVDGGYLAQFSWFFLWPLLPYHLIFVPIFYYYQVVLTDTLEWKNSHLILFVPFFLGVIDVIYIYSQPDHVLASIQNGAIYTPEKRLDAEYWLLSLNEHLLMRHIWQFGVLVYLLPQILQFNKKRHDDRLKLVLNRWLLIFWVILMLMAILVILYSLEKMFVGTELLPFNQSSKIITLTLYLILFVIGVIPLYFPSILHGYPQPVRRNTYEKPEETELKFGLEEQEMEAKLEEIKKKKLYLNQSFSLTECARELELPSHHISYFLKKQYELSFAAYKNNLRMEHAKSLIENGYLENNTIEALASECGFASRTSFSKTFKSLVDVSPSQYAVRGK